MERSKKILPLCAGFLSAALLFYPTLLHASFIESTIGAAVVNDATAAYYNPAALTLLKTAEIIGLGSIASLKTEFNGQVTQPNTDFLQSGDSKSQAKYYVPSAYFGLPINKKISFGLAAVANSFNNTLDDSSILRYAKSNSSVKAHEITPAIGIKLTNFLALGGSVSFSHAKITTEPVIGFPSLNIPDSQSLNEATSNALGGDIGALLTLSAKTQIGLNYRSAVTYKFNGSSSVAGSSFSTDNFGFTYWTPARGVITIAHSPTPKLGLITTVQRIQWSIFDEVNIQNFATSIGPNFIVSNGEIPYHFRDSWLVTVGSQYNVTPKWVVRVASSYDQSPGNPQYQIVNGDGLILGASSGYKISKHFLVDGSYAHEFLKNQDINIVSKRNNIQGVNSGNRNSISLKLTFQS